MGLQPLKYIKKWFTGTFVKEADFDELANKTGAYATRTNNNLKQIGLDLGGPTYDFNNQGKAAFTSNLNGRIGALEAASLIGSSNLGLDLTTNTTVELTAADQSALSSANLGQVVLNYTTTAGVLQKYNISANLSVTLTGADFGFSADLTDQPLWVLLIDTGSAIILGVSPQGGVESVTSGNCKTIVADCTARTHILCSSAVGSTSNVLTLGWIKANYDHTGGASEKLWAIQASQGDVNVGSHPTNLEVSRIIF